MKIDLNYFIKNIILLIGGIICGVILGAICGLVMGFLVYLLSGSPQPFQWSIITNFIFLGGYFGILMGVFLGIIYTVKNYRLYKIYVDKVKLRR